jgi:hypothetical protein
LAVEKEIYKSNRYLNSFTSPPPLLKVQLATMLESGDYAAAAAATAAGGGGASGIASAAAAAAAVAEATPEHEEEARRWWVAAALQGDPEGQYNVGLMFEEAFEEGAAPPAIEVLSSSPPSAAASSSGDGGSGEDGDRGSSSEKSAVKHLNKAMRWYTSAAEQGHAEAAFNLVRPSMLSRRQLLLLSLLAYYLQFLAMPVLKCLNKLIRVFQLLAGYVCRGFSFLAEHSKTQTLRLRLLRPMLWLLLWLRLMRPASVQKSGGEWPWIRWKHPPPSLLRQPPIHAIRCLSTIFKPCYHKPHSTHHESLELQQSPLTISHNSTLTTLTTQTSHTATSRITPRPV